MKVCRKLSVRTTNNNRSEQKNTLLEAVIRPSFKDKQQSPAKIWRRQKPG
jgi:hypothetical protein